MRTIKLEGAFNVRDLGGLAAKDNKITKENVFIRADGTHSLTPADVDKLMSIGVRTVIDLRSKGETELAPSRLAGIDGIYYENIPMLDNIHSGNQVTIVQDSLTALYINLLETEKNSYLRIIKLLTDCPGATLFNCTAGKDRTGVLAMLILSLAEVCEEDILSDYEQSEANLMPLMELQKQYMPKLEVTEYLLSSKREEMAGAINHLRTLYSSARDYFLSFGTPQQVIDALMLKFLN